MAHRNGQAEVKEYIGIIWIGNAPGKRLRLLATSSRDATSQLIEMYGPGHPMSVWNEEDAERRR